MSFLNKYPILLKKVDNRDRNAETKGALWSLIYIGRFIVNKNGWLSYYTTDFHRVRRGNVKIFLGRAQQSGQLTKTWPQDHTAAGRTNKAACNDSYA